MTGLRLFYVVAADRHNLHTVSNVGFPGFLTLFVAVIVVVCAHNRIDAGCSRVFALSLMHSQPYVALRHVRAQLVAFDDLAFARKFIHDVSHNTWLPIWPDPRYSR